MKCHVDVSTRQRETQQNTTGFCTIRKDGTDLCTGSTRTRPESLTQRCKMLFLQLSAANFNEPDGMFCPLVVCFFMHFSAPP